MKPRVPIQAMKDLHLEMLRTGAVDHLFALKEHEPGLATYVIGMSGFVQEYLREEGIRQGLQERIMGDFMVCCSVVIKAMEQACRVSLMSAPSPGNTTTPATPQPTIPEAKHE